MSFSRERERKGEKITLKSSGCWQWTTPLVPFLRFSISMPSLVLFVFTVFYALDIYTLLIFIRIDKKKKKEWMYVCRVKTSFRSTKSFCNHRRKWCRRLKKKRTHSSPFATPAIDRCEWFVATNCNNCYAKVFSLSMSSFGAVQQNEPTIYSIVIDFNFRCDFCFGQATAVTVTHHHQCQYVCVHSFFFLSLSLFILASEHIKSHIIARVLNITSMDFFFFFLSLVSRNSVTFFWS